MESASNIIKYTDIVGAYYDIEVFTNYVSILFLDMKNDQEWIDKYIEADITDDTEGKITALHHIKYRLFIFHESRWDAEEFYEFMKNIKLLIGYNSIKFDDLIIDFLHIIKDIVLTDKERALEKTKTLVDNIIANSGANYKYFDEDLKVFKQWWTSIDLLMALFETISRKSLKQAAINIKWYRIEDLPLHPDTRVFENQFEEIFEYNLNDVLITRALHLKKKQEFTLRINISAKYEINVLSSNRSTIADRLMGKFYSDYTGLKFFHFKDKRTIRNIIQFGDVINPKIAFNSKELHSIHEEIINTTFYVGQKFSKTVLFRNKGYNVATGGLHSVDRPGWFEADCKDMFLRDGDVSSYYPSLVYNEGVCPAHLAPVAFQQIVKMIITDRLAYKANIKPLKAAGRYAEMEDAKTGAETLKIVANSGLFGKMGYDGWLLDLKAMYQVTLNGQLYLLMWIEQLEDAGIEVISANTDGVLVKLNKSKLDDYEKIAKEWQVYTKLGLEFTDYIKYVRTSVNSYVAIKKDWRDNQSDDEIKRKDEFLTEVELSKGFNSPIVAIAMDKYIVHGIPIENTIRNHTDIYDYCISVKTGEGFKKELHTLYEGEYNVDLLSKNLRYYVSNKGGTLLKHKTAAKENEKDKYANMLRGAYITPFNDYFRCDNMLDYDINYHYYIKRCTEMLLKINGEYSRPGSSRVFKGSKKKGVEQIGKLFDNI